MPYKVFTVEGQHCVFKVDADGNKTGDSLGCHDTEDKANDQMAAIMAEEEMRHREQRARGLFDRFWQGIKELFAERRIKDVDNWDGSASRFASTGDYCDACLINLNEGPRDEWTQTNCKLPVRGPGDGSDTYVRQAVHAAAQRFNQVDAPAEAKDKARRKLLSIYREMDEEPPEVLTRAMSMSRLHQAIWSQLLDRDSTHGEDNYMMDIYAEDDGTLYALCTDRGKLYRHQLSVDDDNVMLGERVQVMESHQPVATRTVVRQQADGRWRWFSVSGTAVLNRSGEIDSRELFDSFVRHAEETGINPIRMFYHQGQVSREGKPDEQARLFRTGQADYLARDGFCYITSGLYDDTPLAQAEVRARQANPDFWGDSIGFWPWDMSHPYELTQIADGISIPMYRDGLNVEITTLPEAEASHLFTRTEVTRRMLDQKAWEAFVKLWDGDEEKARQWLEQNPQARNRAIEQGGLITRQDGEQPPEEIEVGEEVITAVVQAVVESETVKGLQTKLAEAETQLTQRATEVTELKAAVTKLVARLEKLEGKQAAVEQQAEDDTPARLRQQTRVVYRPRLANAAAVEDGTPYNEKANANMPKGAY